MTEDHQDENLPNSEEPKAIVRRLTWPIDPSLPSRDVKTDRGPGGGSTAIPLGCDRRTRKFSSPLAPSSTCASQGRHHHRCARQHRRRVRPKVATIKLAIATVQVSSRRPASESPSQVRIITARRVVQSALVTCSTFVDGLLSKVATINVAHGRIASFFSSHPPKASRIKFRRIRSRRRSRSSQTIGLEQ